MENTLKIIPGHEANPEELRVGNYIVLFGGRDLAGEYFDPAVDLESDYTKSVGRLPVDWEHGLDEDPASPQWDNVLGYVDWKTAKRDRLGVWVERVLNRRNEYVEYLQELIAAGLLGTSSHAAERDNNPDGKITVWRLMRDALTIRPAEPRMMAANTLQALKSIAPMCKSARDILEAAGNAAMDAAGVEPAALAAKNININGVTMTEKTYTHAEMLEILAAGKDAPPEAIAKLPDHLKPYEAQQAAIQSDLKALQASLDMIVNAPALKDAGYIAPDSGKDHAASKSFGDYLHAVRTKNDTRLKHVYKVALAEGAGATGGYLVPTEFAPQLEGQIAFGSVLRRAGVRQMPMASAETEIGVVDITTAPSAGNTSYAGGAVAYWLSEAASITESEPAFKQVRLVAKELAGLALASRDLMQDAMQSIDGILASSLTKAVASQENYQFFRGTGGGLPRGILESGAYTAETRSAASAIALADVAALEARMFPDATRKAYFCNPRVLVKLIQLVSNPIAWLENAREGRPVQLMGSPLYVTGALPTLNTSGDILHVDLDSYIIGDRGALEIAFSEHYKFNTGQGTWRIIRRVDGQPLYDSAVTLEDASTTVAPFVGLAAG